MLVGTVELTSQKFILYSFFQLTHSLFIAAVMDGITFLAFNSVFCINARKTQNLCYHFSVPLRGKNVDYKHKRITALFITITN